MGRTIYAYKGRLWNLVSSFYYTGEMVSHELSTGSHLLICHGARGGISTAVPTPNYGGSAYGVVTLTSPTTINICVGGDGDPAGSTATVGGFNGGGAGTAGMYAYSPYGAGGGGATDIRIGGDTLYHRILVAGGGGGNSEYDMSGLSYPINTGYGGGIVGGFFFGNTADPYHLAYASQSEGNAFGQGATGPKRGSNKAHAVAGAGGGGGGWYGGYCSNIAGYYSSVCGGGGSGYAVTSDSFKPEGYLVDPSYYLADVMLTCGTGDVSSVLIFDEVSSFVKEDHVVFPCIGESEHIALPKGTYQLSCYGGAGGWITKPSNSSKGGFTQGTVSLQSAMNDVYVNVGGSGYYSSYISPTYANLSNPSCSFNGGGSPATKGTLIASQSLGTCGTSGGGATDIRININDLFHRIIVAGGAGGVGKTATGGNMDGGGETGGTPNSTSYNYAPGPGTQTGSPSSSSYGSSINGSFGVGGNGVGVGGAGGSGWYGGCGVYQQAIGGSGGSGYTLTSESYKPIGYTMGSEYYLTDTTNTLGGNQSISNVGYATIDVISIQAIKFVCHDEVGYKRYDEASSSWVYLSDDITSEQINEYGSFSMISDDGLLSEYEIVLYDSTDTITGATVSVVPNKQTISSIISSTMKVNDYSVDAEYDVTDHALNVNVRSRGVGDQATVSIDIEIEKQIETTHPFRLYCVQVFGK